MCRGEGAIAVSTCVVRMLQKAVGIGAEMNKRALEEVAKVGQ